MADSDTKDETKASARKSAETQSQPAGSGEVDRTIERDALNMGYPMLESDPADEPTGPEDVLGEGPTRGDYSGFINPTYHPHTVVPGAQREDGSYEPVVLAQREFVEQGMTPPGTKGGVDSAQK